MWWNPLKSIKLSIFKLWIKFLKSVLFVTENLKTGRNGKKYGIRSYIVVINVGQKKVQSNYLEKLQLNNLIFVSILELWIWSDSNSCPKYGATLNEWFHPKKTEKLRSASFISVNGAQKTGPVAIG